MSQVTATDKSDSGRKRKSPQELADLAVTPRIKVFLSADIVGSTAFKQTFKLDEANLAASVRDRRMWQETIELFYDKMKDRFPVIWDKTFRDYRNGDGEALASDLDDMVAGKAPRFWKTVGDEVIFWKELGHEAQLWGLLHAWLTTIAEIRDFLRPRSLDVKSTIWTAEFPVRNCALPARNNEIKTAQEALLAGVFDPLGLRSPELGKAGARPVDDNQQLIGEYYDRPYRNAKEVDFIGPGIDVGFRIAEFSSNRRMAISVDVAYLLAVSRINHFGYKGKTAARTIPGLVRCASMVMNAPGRLREFIEKLELPKHFSCRHGDECRKIFNIDINYSGTSPLKGVLGSTSYPRFWISTIEEDSYEYHKQRLYLDDSMQRVKPEWGQLVAYCASFYEEHKSYIKAPIIVRNIFSQDDSMKWSSTCTDDGFKTYVKAHDAAAAYRPTVEA